MLKYPSISKQNPGFPDYIDFQKLRKTGIDHLQELAGKLWTDYNLHDPGVTILEVLCYAITDLGYRNNLDIEDLLALAPGASENNFFTPDQILTCNPVTILDIRKRLIDIPGVNNAWLKKAETYDPPIWIDPANSKLQLQDKLPRLNLRGLYKVYLDLDPDYHKNACGQLYRSWSNVLDEVKQVLCRYRNLCEDIHEIVIVNEEEIRLCADVELAPDADAENALVEIYEKIHDFLVPQIHFHTLQQLLEKKQNIAEVFAGRPSRNDLGERYESHGFIDTDELETITLPEILYTSDFYQKILDVSGVTAIKKLLIASSINGLPQSKESSWYLQLMPQYRPVLSLQDSTIRLFKNGLPVPVNLDEVQRRYYEQRAAYIKTKRDPYELDLSVPKGKYLPNLAEHYPIHHDFPLTYGISEDGLPDPVSVQRLAQTKQLKGYLVFFDQLLANYLAQLSHVRDLFTWEKEKTQQTYFSQPISFPGSQEILDSENMPKEHYLGEEEEASRDRRNRFLDHLLARFAESFTDYVLLNYKMYESHSDKAKHEAHLIEEKANFLKDYPVLSRDRFRAFNYCDCKAVWGDTTEENVSGFKKRVSRLLGIENIQRRNLNHYKVEQDSDNLILSVQLGSSVLTSKPIYATENNAHAALEKFLSFALCSNYYKRLTYSYFYHYGLEVEVMHEDEPIQARYTTHFFSRRDRNNALNELQNLPILQAVSSDKPDKDGLYSFYLKTSNQETIFTGVQKYFSKAMATAKAEVISGHIREQKNYHGILFLPNGEAERESQTPSHEARFTHYGYALVDNKGTVLAESSQQFPDANDRDVDLNRWLSTIRAGNFTEDPQNSSLPGSFGSSVIAFSPPEQFEFAQQSDKNGSYFVLKTGNSPILRSLKSYAENDKDAVKNVWNDAYAFAQNLFHLNRYISPVQDQTGETYPLGITDAKGELLAISETGSIPLELFKRLNSVEPFLSTSLVQVETLTQTVQRYRCQLCDRNGTILLEATQLFEDAETARDRFYQDVLGNLFEPGLRYTSTDKDGFGFGVLSRAGDRSSKVAVHPQTYTTEQERDAALNRLFLLIRTAQIKIDISFNTKKTVGRLYGQKGLVLLQSAQFYSSEEEGWAKGRTLLELASVEAQFPTKGKPDGKNFRLIDMEDDSEGIYGWELTNEAKDQTLASHFYAGKRDRRKEAIKTIQQHVNDEGFHVLEHILLRPRQPLLIDLELLTFWWKWYLRLKADQLHQTGKFIILISLLLPKIIEKLLPIQIDPNEAKPGSGETFTIARQDPYSFWVSIVLPYWSERFQDINFRRFVERTLRLEAPAHVALKIAWVDQRQMNQFETAYRTWLEQLAQTACEDVACNLVDSLNDLIKILTQLKSVYPQGNLVRSEASRSQINPIILNQTALGSVKD